jgi:hypothetical protein
MWGALSDKRTGLSFTIAAGPRQRSHSRVQVPWGLCILWEPYETHKHTNTLGGQTAQILYAKENGTYSNHWALKA